MSEQTLQPIAVTDKDTFLKALRAQTGPCHVKLEQNPYSTVLMSPNLTTEDYKVYIQKMYGFVAPFEDAVYPVLASIMPDIDQRRKAHLMVADLKTLGMSSEEIDSLPMYSYETDVTMPAALGAMYVMEGSALGGRVILKHVKNVLPSAAEAGAYFSVYGPELGKMWQSFLDTFTNYTLENNCSEELIAKATATFENIDGFLGTK